MSSLADVETIHREEACVDFSHLMDGVQDLNPAHFSLFPVNMLPENLAYTNIRYKWSLQKGLKDNSKVAFSIVAISWNEMLDLNLWK